MEQINPGRSPWAVCTDTCEAKSRLRSKPPTGETFKNPSSSIQVTIMPISSTWASSIKFFCPFSGWRMVQIKSPSGLIDTSPSARSSSAAIATTDPSRPETPTALDKRISKSLQFMVFILSLRRANRQPLWVGGILPCYGFKAATSLLKCSPRFSKFGYRSKLALAGDKATMSPMPARPSAVCTACSIDSAQCSAGCCPS